MPRLAAATVGALMAVVMPPAASAQPRDGGAPAMPPPLEAAVRPRYDAPAWVRERRHQATRRSRELLLHEMNDAPAIGWLPRTPRERSPAEVVAIALRRLEDLELFAATDERDARTLDEVPVFNPPEATLRVHQRAQLLAEATRYREAAVATARVALERGPEARHADELLFRMAGLLAALGREDESRAAFDAVVVRYPSSPFAPHVRLDAGERAFARGEWAAAAVAYERASLPASPDNRARAYALYRLAWARALAGEPGVALAHFDQALAWIAAHPDVPDADSLAEVARQERAALAARLAVRRPARRRTAPLRAPRAPAAPAARPTT